MIFVSNIPSHKEVFDIQSDIYLGEYFDLNENSFGLKINELRNSFDRVNKYDIQGFKNDNLSNSSMANSYLKIYKDLIKNS